MQGDTCARHDEIVEGCPFILCSLLQLGDIDVTGHGADFSSRELLTFIQSQRIPLLSHLKEGKAHRANHAERQK